ncbi:GNAT family N-acetyltransferase [Streptomyces sp. NPDC046866]|uniref:GNAT family N-acetyltransferase n=1 Tax=Streptomyces sp. NPDC046866 TaxID=3154921 RepID=UPI003452339A
MEQHVIRPVRAEEWQKVKEFRLDALRDPVAPMAFLETLEQASAQPDSFWQERARRAAEGVQVKQFVAEDAGGRWDGSVSVFVEAQGDADFFGRVIPENQGHVVGVFVRPGQRGSGLTDALFEAALQWMWSLEEPVLSRARLFVHEGNERAGGFYRRFGFRASGLVVPKPGDASAKELEYLYPRPAAA